MSCNLRPFVLLPPMLATTLLWGQANKATISGLVLDANGNPVADAAVGARNHDTGLTRETRTNERGFYRFASIDAGFYDFQVDASSIGVRVKDVEAHAGGWVEVNVRIGLSNSNGQVEVDSSAVSVTDSLATHVLPFEVIRDLPIDGRRFQDFATLSPTVEAVDASLNELSFLGQRPVYGNVMVDGTDYNEAFQGGIRGGDRANFAFTVPQSAVQEFQTITNGFSAEYGRSTGGVLNAITRSGSNATHAEAFYQIRNSALSLANPFDLNALENQQQFGGAAGGAIQKNRLFWFASAEGQLASTPRQVQFAELNSVANSLTPSIVPAYNYFQSLQRPYTQTNNAFAALARLDYQISGSSRLTGHFNISRDHAANAASDGTSWIPETSSALSNNGTEKDFVRTGVVQWTACPRKDSLHISVLWKALASEFFGADYATEAK